MKKVFVALLIIIGSILTVNAQCPYNSVQIRVQINTNTPWATSTQAAYDKSIHIGAFRNGWGVPVDPGTVTVYAVQGAYWQVVPLSGWEAWWKPGVPKENDVWTFYVYCSGQQKDRATATWAGSLDVLSYILPNWPASPTGSEQSVITEKTNYWRTYSGPGGNVGERLPGFFITKGGIDWGYDSMVMWNFEQMIYDNEWIYLVRDTSWTDTCNDNGHVAGQLLFTYDHNSNQWLRGGRHFPRYIANGTSRDTGYKWIQGVQRAVDHNDTGGEGRWCQTPHGSTQVDKDKTVIYGEWIGRKTLGNRTFGDVLMLKAVGGVGESDVWWFAKGYGFVYFEDRDHKPYERHESTAIHPVTVRIPCHPNAPCM